MSNRTGGKLPKMNRHILPLKEGRNKFLPPNGKRFVVKMPNKRLRDIVPVGERQVAIVKNLPIVLAIAISLKILWQKATKRKLSMSVGEERENTPTTLPIQK